MAEGGMESEDYLKYMAEDSGNVAADGNFSVQVCTTSCLKPIQPGLDTFSYITLHAIGCVQSCLNTVPLWHAELACSISGAVAIDHTQQAIV